MTSGRSDRELIVVGVDGGPPSKAALGWAVRYGRKTDAMVRAVTAWRIEPPFGEAIARPEESYEREARKALDGAIEEIQAVEPEFAVETRVQRGEPTNVLVEQARDADLLVLGDKGRHPLAGMLAGSIVTRSLHKAPCPVVIVGQQMGPAPHCSG